ncbi:MAG: hypothetical protein JSW58_15715 [Candidatus Latescibacterota bacterium]|nr:MAG: hypothetical protein JSW58_15715 [Candidatus Latescibacterota bacterium]
MRASPKIALLEIGTNSTKLLIARPHTTEIFHVCHFSRKTTRIGRRLTQTRRISKRGVDENIDTIKAFATTIRQHRCQHVFAFATFAFRQARNAKPVLSRLEKALDAPVKILSGREEACFAYLSARVNLRLKNPLTVLADIGGGSTELIVAREGRVTHAKSLPIGALHLTERFVRSDPIGEDDFLLLSNFVDNVCNQAVAVTGILGHKPDQMDLVASGGTIGSLALVISGRAAFPKHDTSRGGPSRIAAREVRGFLNRCLELPLEKRKRIRGLEPDRADIICAGLAIVTSIMKATGKRVVYPNRGGVREGALVHLIQNGLRW